MTLHKNIFIIYNCKKNLQLSFIICCTYALTHNRICNKNPQIHLFKMIINFHQIHICMEQRLWFVNFSESVCGSLRLVKQLESPMRFSSPAVFYFSADCTDVSIQQVLNNSVTNVRSVCLLTEGWTRAAESIFHHGLILTSVLQLTGDVSWNYRRYMMLENQNCQAVNVCCLIEASYLIYLLRVSQHTPTMPALCCTVSSEMINDTTIRTILVPTCSLRKITRWSVQNKHQFHRLAESWNMRKKTKWLWKNFKGEQWSLFCSDL